MITSWYHEIPVGHPVYMSITLFELRVLFYNIAFLRFVRYYASAAIVNGGKK